MIDQNITSFRPSDNLSEEVPLLPSIISIAECHAQILYHGSPPEVSTKPGALHSN